MIIFLIAYIVGFVLSLVMFIHTSRKDNDITVSKLIFITAISFFSWFSIFAQIVANIIINKEGWFNKVVFKQKK